MYELTPTLETSKTYDPDSVRQIKTIVVRLDAADSFDRKVNALLRDGWKIAKRYTIAAQTDSEYTMLVAEMYRFANKNEVE